MGEHPPLSAIVLKSPGEQPRVALSSQRLALLGSACRRKRKPSSFRNTQKQWHPCPAVPHYCHRCPTPGPMGFGPFSCPSRLCWTSTLQDHLKLCIHSELFHTQTTSSPGTRLVTACAQQEAHEATARHGLCGGTGQQRGRRPRGGKGIVLDWRIVTQMAREKQIGREMNKLY